MITKKIIMSLRDLFNRGCDTLENVIGSIGKNIEELSLQAEEWSNELNSPYNIHCEELEHFIKLFERYIELVKRCEKLCPNFSVDEYIKSGKHLRKLEDLDFFDVEHNYFECIEKQKNIENKIRELAQNIFGETVASLEVIKIKEHLYKNWKFK